MGGGRGTTNRVNQMIKQIKYHYQETAIDRDNGSYATITGVAKRLHAERLQLTGTIERLHTTGDN